LKNLGKRGKDKYTEKKVLENTSAIVDVDEELMNVDMNEEQEIKEQSLTAAPVVEHSTPEEEDEAMKEIYERPSPSPTDSIGSSIIDAKENEIPTDTNVISEVTTQDQPEQDLKIKKDEEEEVKNEIVEKSNIEKEDTIESNITENSLESVNKEIKTTEQEVDTEAEASEKMDAEIQENIEDIIETDGKKDINDANVESNNEKEVVDVNTATDEKELIDVNTATDEKEVVDANTATDEKEVIDANIMTDKKQVCDVFVETDAKENQDFQQQTDTESAKIKLKEFLNVMKDLCISDLTHVISRAAQAINDKNV